MAEAVKKKRMVGEMMVGAGLINETQLKKALDEQRKRGGKLGEILVSLGFLTEHDFASILAQQLNISYVEIEKELVDVNTVRLLPEEMARRLAALPLYKRSDMIAVAMADPLDIFALDEIRSVLSREVFQLVAARSDILRSVSRYYGVSPEIDAAAQTFAEQTAAMGKGGAEVSSLVSGEDAPVSKLVSMVIAQAIMDRASDIHIDPEGKSIKVRYRIDGLLREVKSFPRDMHAPIISRIKILANMDIGEKRIPQDGRFQAKLTHTASGPVVTSVFTERSSFRADDDSTVDVRVSTLPVIQGETAVMRILSRAQIINNVEGLNFAPDMFERYRRLIARPFGMILVTGPTGSGKSTTLHASINSLDRRTNNIITVEDPVEYQIGGVNQLQVNPKAGVTFASGLRSILRQDPDIIMVGEIRDLETAEIAIHAALTGHLVLSSLHTNDAAGAASRLIDMGVEPFLIASSVSGIVAQRLVRMICEHCKKPFKAPAQLLSGLGINAASATFYRGEGCAACKNTGYRGRIGLFELMEVTEAIRGLIVSKASSAAIKAEAAKSGSRTLRQEGLFKAAAGITTIEEVLRVTMAEAGET
jgi:type IV pilus assembly protein PilB